MPIESSIFFYGVDQACVVFIWILMKIYVIKINL